DGDDADNHQQLDEGKPAAVTPGRTHDAPPAGNTGSSAVRESAKAITFLFRQQDEFITAAVVGNRDRGRREATQSSRMDFAWGSRVSGVGTNSQRTPAWMVSRGADARTTSGGGRRGTA